MVTKRLIVAALVLITGVALAQNKKDSLGLPGDNFDLYAALELFRRSDSPEAFEKAINSKDNEVNNLDLDADGKVDYVKVVDRTENNAHSLVMQVAVSKDEMQDVAVIEIEKTGDKTAHVQIVGDEELYGKDYIVEPSDQTSAGVATKSKERLATDNSTDDVYATSGEKGNERNQNNSGDYNSTASASSGGGVTVVNVWGWPSVQYMYGPVYSPWVSPWYWGYYPGWWSPWYPIYWGVYYRRVWHYHYPYYRRAYFYRSPVAHNYYYGRRATANRVREYNRSGLYHQRQQAYRANVEPGRRYNAAPANPRNRGGVREGEDRHMRNGRDGTQRSGNREAAPRQRSGGVQGNTPRHVEGQAAPRERSSPGGRQMSPAPSGGNRGVGTPAPRGGGGGGHAPRGGGSGGGGRSGR